MLLVCIILADWLLLRRYLLDFGILDVFLRNDGLYFYCWHYFLLVGISDWLKFCFSAIIESV